MKTGNAILSLLLLAQAAAPAFAQEFRLAVISASDIRQFDSQVPAVAQAVAELSGLNEVEAGSYLADSEPDGEEKTADAQPSAASLGGDGTIRLYHEWNKETIEVRYRGADGRYIPEAFEKLKHFMRCRLTGKETAVPARLAEILDALQDRLGGATVTVICGYRSPELNSALSSNSSGVAKNSLHLKGWAADIKVPGVRTSALRDAAKALKAGGVGYYPSDGFVHVDAGRVRYW
ncbi:MAG: YcbK family protein [Elusimicrobia bacterium]|nr:YcbK family protein [Elusimicrobiota bacterium]